MLVKKIKNDIRTASNKENARFAQIFFKTGPGQYGEGDIFLGLSVPTSRKIVKKYLNQVTLKDLSQIIKSKFHEERFFVLASLAELSKKANKKNDQKIIKLNRDFYIKHKKWINNWDLVDVSAEHVTGAYYFYNSRKDLFKLARSKNLWDRRIAVITTLYFIRRSDYKTTVQLCKLLLKDKHDLIHKATGWMLREVGKRDIKVLHKFLKSYAHIMPRTMLRYSIEKLSTTERKKYLNYHK